MNDNELLDYLEDYYDEQVEKPENKESKPAFEEYEPDDNVSERSDSEPVSNTNLDDSILQEFWEDFDKVQANARKSSKANESQS